MLPALVDTAAMEISATSNAAHRPDGHRRVGVERNPPSGTIVIPSIPRKPSSNVAMNSAPCRCAAATIAASAKLTSGAANAELTQRGRKEIATGQKVQLLLIQQDIRNVERRAKARALRTLWDEAAIGIASHQVDVFIFEPGTDRYLVRLCNFNACPKGKAECRVSGCGDVALLRQHEGFRWRAESLAEGRAVRLFERATGLRRRASDLPLLDVEALGDGVPDGMGIR